MGFGNSQTSSTILKSSNISSSNVVEIIIDALTCNGTLQELELRKTDVNDIGAIQQIATELETNTSVKRLGLSFNYGDVENDKKYLL